MRCALFVFLFLLFCNLDVKAQSGFFPLNNEMEELLLSTQIDSQYNFHTSIKPYQFSEIVGADSIAYKLAVAQKTLAKRFLDEPLMHGGKNFKYEVSPIIQMMGSYGNYDMRVAKNEKEGSYWMGLGAQISASWKEQLALRVEYTASQFAFQTYVDDYAQKHAVIPAFGEYRVGNSGVYYNDYLVGNLSYSPSKILTLEVGRGKHFYGNGYRSLLLSDNSMAYPYGKITLNIWKLKYQVLYSNYQHPTLKNRQDNSVNFYGIDERKNKYSTSNYLSMNIGKHANVALFQSVVWQAGDSLHDRGFDVNYLNPFIFMRPVEFSVGSPDNVLLGADFSYTIFKKHKFYAQLVLDEFILDEIKSGNGWWGNKYGYQLGLSMRDFFKLKGIHLRLEYNEVRPYTYAHTNVVQNYGHLNTELAHPLGANFKEGLVQLTYAKKRWLFSVQFNHSIQGLTYPDSLNYGDQIYTSNTNRQEYGNYTTQGNKSVLSYQKLDVSYLINPSWRLMAFIGVSNRERTFENRENLFSYGNYEKNQMVYIGIKTALYNQYLDF